MEAFSRLIDGFQSNAFISIMYAYSRRYSVSNKLPYLMLVVLVHVCLAVWFKTVPQAASTSLIFDMILFKVFSLHALLGIIHSTRHSGERYLTSMFMQQDACICFLATKNILSRYALGFCYICHSRFTFSHQSCCRAA